jgi:hypothetical protein
VDATAIHETEQIFFIRHEDLDEGKLKTRRGGKGKGQRRFDNELGGVHRAVVQAPDHVHSVAELDDGMEEEVRGDLHRLEEGWSQTAASDGLFVTQHSSALCVVFEDCIFIVTQHSSALCVVFEDCIFIMPLISVLSM